MLGQSVYQRIGVARALRFVLLDGADHIEAGRLALGRRRRRLDHPQRLIAEALDEIDEFVGLAAHLRVHRKAPPEPRRLDERPAARQLDVVPVRRDGEDGEANDHLEQDGTAAGGGVSGRAAGRPGARG